MPNACPLGASYPGSWHLSFLKPWLLTIQQVFHLALARHPLGHSGSTASIMGSST